MLASDQICNCLVIALMHGASVHLANTKHHFQVRQCWNFSTFQLLIFQITQFIMFVLNRV